MLRLLSKIDSYVVGSYQWLYEAILDNVGVRIGSFRMSVALTPIVFDLILRGTNGFFLVQAAITSSFLFIVFFAFYDFRIMRADNRMQERNAFAPLNFTAELFQSRTLHVRLFYLGFFGFSALVNRDLAGIGLISIVYARCVKVRARIEPQRRLSPAAIPA